MGFLVKQRLFFAGGGGLGLYEHFEICLLYIYIYIFVRFVVTGSN